MTFDEFRSHYKILYGDIIMKDVDIHDLRDIAAAALSYINLTNQYDKYQHYKTELKKHLNDFDIVMGMIDERNE